LSDFINNSPKQQQKKGIPLVKYMEKGQNGKLAVIYNHVNNCQNN
jgi:hypothetical protein